MRRMFSLARAGLEGRRRSSLLLLTTITLSVVFLVVMGLIGSSSLYTLDWQKKDTYGEQKALCWNLSPAAEKAVLENPAWTEVGRMTVYGAVASRQDTWLGIGALDEAGRRLAHIRLTAGRLPETAAEIVLEASAYKHIGSKPYAVGDDIALDIAAAGDTEGEPQTRRYTVVGLMDSYTAVWKNTYTQVLDGASPLLPASFLLSEEGGRALAAGAGQMEILLLNGPSSSYDVLRAGIPKGAGWALNYNVYPSIGYHGGMGEDALGVLGVSALLGGAILLCMMAVLLNGFLMAVDRRKRQLALLRSIGATRKQARSVIFCEAFLLMGIGIPLGLLLGVALSFGAVKLFSIMGQSELHYHFSPWVLLLSAAICVACVSLAVLLPALRASRTAPIAGLRPVYFKNKGRAKARRGGRTPLRPLTLMLLSLRKSKLKTALTTLIFALVIVVFNLMMLFNLTAYTLSYEIPNLSVYTRGTSGYRRIAPAKPPEAGTSLPLSVFDTLRRNDAVARQNATVDTQFFCAVPLDRYDSYLNGYFHFDYEMLGVSGRGRFHYDFGEQGEFGYTDQEYLIPPNVSIFDDALLREFAPYVTDGAVDPEAVNRGEEILLCMPDYLLQVEHDEHSMSTHLELVRQDTQFAKDKTLYTNTRWKAGETLTLTWVEEKEDGSFARHDKAVRIGAILRDTPPTDNNARSVFGIAVGEQTLARLGLPYQIDRVAVYFRDDADIEATEAELEQMVSNAYPSAELRTKTEEALADQRLRRTTLSVMAMLTVSLLALGFLGLMNTVSSRIYARSHEIGLLRCIGMTKGQVCRMLLYEGAVFGVLASLVGSAVCAWFLPRLQDNWAAVGTPYYLALSCAVCIVLAVLTIFFPARAALKSSPVETVRRND